MRLIDTPYPSSAEDQLVPNRAAFHDWWIEARLDKGIDEPLGKLIEHISAPVYRDRSLQYLRKRAEIVDTMDMIGMIMRNDYGVYPVNFCFEQLLSEVRTTIDDEALAGTLKQDRRSESPVARLVGVAFAPAIPDPRNTRRGSTAENSDFHGCTALLNRR
jgi:hypothetical protein